MRVTQKIIFGNFMRDINTNRSQLAKLQSDLSSGRSVRLPSQGPFAFQGSRVIEENIRKTEQYQDNLTSGLRQGRLAQEALDEVADWLIDAKNIVVKGSSDSLGDKERESLADQISGIRESIVSTLNQSYGDRFLFAGTNSDQRPFELNAAGPGGVERHSNNKPLQILADDGVKIDVSITGTEVVTTESGADLFETLTSIEEALRDNDVDTINGRLTATNDAIEHVTNLGARLGNSINRMDFMYEQYESNIITQESENSELVDTDYAQSFSDLQRNQVAYEAAMAVHSTMFNNTLLDYL